MMRLRRLGAMLNGRGRGGQSLVELTLTMPILLLMLFGLIEIGWYANSYLILLDASREAGRYGANLSPGDQWQFGWSDRVDRHNCCSGRNAPANCTKNTRPEIEPLIGPPYDSELPFGYYEAVACRVLDNLPPLDFDWNRDEVIISVFSYTAYDAGRTPFERIDPLFPNAGRWPIERNQCVPADPANLTTDHLGFTLTAVGNSECDTTTGQGCANHRRDDGCWGSEWDPGEIEARLETSSPAGALVLVEVFWWHDQLLGLPFFSSLANPAEIYIWIMFPVSAAEPTPTPIP
jgi:hypothetical protein